MKYIKPQVEATWWTWNWITTKETTNKCIIKKLLKQIQVENT